MLRSCIEAAAIEKLDRYGPREGERMSARVSINRSNTANREYLAHHEAAHAVIARMLGVPCLGILMFPTDDSNNAGALVQSAAFHADVGGRLGGLKKDALVWLAGPVANVRLSGDPKHFSIGAKSDLKAAQDAALKAALLSSGVDLPWGPESFDLEVDSKTIKQANSVLKDWRVEAEQLVCEHWPKIERVARALLTADMLVEAEVDRLIAG
jgi:hypothetical protein